MRYKYVQKKYYHIVRPSFGSQLNYVIFDAVMIFIAIALVEEYCNPPLYAKNVFTLSQLLLLEILLAIAILILSFSILQTKLVLYTSGIEYFGLGYSKFAKWKEIKGVRKYGKYKEYTLLLLHESKLETTFIPKRLLRLLNYDKTILLTRFEKYWEQTDWGEYLYKKAKINYWRDY
jgi:hypothetical protein